MADESLISEMVTNDMSLDLSLYKIKIDHDKKTSGKEQVWTRSITHNLRRIADECKVDSSITSLGDLLWHPKESGYTQVTKEYREKIISGFEYLRENKITLEKLAPENGWGTYDAFYTFVLEYIFALQFLNLDDETYYIDAGI